MVNDEIPTEMEELLKGVEDRWLLWLKQCIIDEQSRRLEVEGGKNGN